ncbi:MAG: PqqD family protein [Desulfobacterales bacterium]|nr:PqqD family protein [Desulfobacterales bacterium]
MNDEVDLNRVYVPSEDVVARVIEDEIIIVPLVSGIGDLEDEIYTLNETGRSIWEKLDEKKKLRDIVEELTSEFDSSAKELEIDVVGFVQELLNRKMLIET